MAREKSEFILTGIDLQPDAKLPIYRQLYDGLRQAILDGRLRPGQKLPATRDIAHELGVSRNTVLLAYDYLLSEGYIEGKTGSGTYITETIPDNLLQLRQKSPDEGHTSSAKPKLSQRGQYFAATSVSVTTTPEDVVPFQPGVPAIHDFPFLVWSRIASRQLRYFPTQSLRYGDPPGYRVLREQLADYLRMARAVRCEAEQIIIVSGSQQALDLSARVLLDAGEAAWIEDPGYIGCRSAMLASGVDLVPVPVDDEGLNVAEGKQLAPAARLAYATPSHQYPLGVTMSLARRLELLDWAAQNDAWILEDDYDSEYRYAGRPLSSLQGLDRNGRVIYLGTFSKVLFPALRLGYMVVPPALVDVFSRAKSACDRHCPIFEQRVLAQFLEDGHFGRHIRRMRMLYHERQEVLVESAERELDGALTIRRSNAGLHVVGWLDRAFSDVKIAAQAQRCGLIAPSLASYTLKHTCPPGLVLGYAPFDAAKIQSGVETLARLLQN